MDSVNEGPDDASTTAHKLELRAMQRENNLKMSGAIVDDGSPSLGIGIDFGSFQSKDDHVQRPCWTCPDGTIYLEAFHELYTHAMEFFVAIAEPVARPEFIHQYKLTPYSLYAAVATNIETERIIVMLERLSKNFLPPQVKQFIRDCTCHYGKAKLLLRRNKFYVESESPMVLRELLRDPAIAQARVLENVDQVDEQGFIAQAKAKEMKENLAMLRAPDEPDEDSEDDLGLSRDGTVNGLANSKVVVSFRVDGAKVETVKRQAIELDYPLMEEYDFQDDLINPNLPLMDLKPNTCIRQYQKRSLNKMFGNGRARSGIIVLPCGAGKTLTGVAAAARIKKSVICLTTNSLSVLQWKHQFQKWTTIPDERISVFTGSQKDDIHPEACVLVTTYSMISHPGQRSEMAKKIMDQITGREWGLLLMDEVHVAPAKMFRRVVGTVKAHCRLGLTATLVREDDLIGDLNFLIGPKLYEANWMDLTAQGYLANVQCVEAQCPMTGPFMKEYLTASDGHLKQLLYVMNPGKVRAAEFLVRFHEERGDKIILFGDLVYPLQLYAKLLKRPFICGKTPELERQAILGTFRTTDEIRTICLSKVGDVAIDLPEANVIIQVSSHFASRRQEAQRLGRILRPKADTPKDVSSRCSFNAFFYTLVSNDTREMLYSAKRQQYLIDQGYTYKVVTDLCDKAAADEALKHGYACGSPEDDRQLLIKVLASKEESGKEQHRDDAVIYNNYPEAAALTDGHLKRSVRATAKFKSSAQDQKVGLSKEHPLFRKRQRR